MRRGIDRVVNANRDCVESSMENDGDTPRDDQSDANLIRSIAERRDKNAFRILYERYAGLPAKEWTKLKQPNVWVKRPIIPHVESRPYGALVKHDTPLKATDIKGGWRKPWFLT